MKESHLEDNFSKNSTCPQSWYMTLMSYNINEFPKGNTGITKIIRFLVGKFIVIFSKHSHQIFNIISWFSLDIYSYISGLGAS